MKERRVWASVPVVMVSKGWGQLFKATPFRGLTLILAGLVTPTAKPGRRGLPPAWKRLFSDVVAVRLL